MSPATGTTTLRTRATTGSRVPARALALAALASLALLGLLAPAHAHADAYLGSTELLRHAPDAPEPVFIDSVFWLTALAADAPGMERYLVTQPGQILQFELRGYTGSGAPAPIHFQDLRPGAGGSLTIAASTQAYALPTTDGVWSYDPVNFCVRAGDYLGFNEEGGGDVRVFGAVQGSTTQRFSANNATMNGDAVTPTPLPNVELLMAAYEGTGAHASPLCGGIAGIELHVSARSAAVRHSGATALPLACTGPFPCSGTLRVDVTQVTPGRGSTTATIAQAPFSLAARAQRTVSLSVDALGRRLLRAAHGHLAATVDASLGAGGPDDTVQAELTLTG